MPPIGNSNARFSSTQWSLIVQAKGTGAAADNAMARLCQRYWYPVYAFLRRKRGVGPHDAEDLTQGFFAHLLSGDWLATVEPEAKRKFRTFLLACLDHYAMNTHRAATARKRTPDGQPLVSLDAQEAEERYRLEPAGGPEPAQLYEIKMAEALLDHALKRLQEECAANNKAGHFEILRPHLTGEAERGDHTETARALGIAPEAARAAASRLRKQFRGLIRSEVAAIVDGPHEIDGEIRYMLSLWKR